ncbi:hypothetical protein GGTG_13195 [Gaeumannomyces tritici R3-111a-1]|uniref:Uncharacterized protein n=1 Tax=Gaeumannomyces tritici (strain R3-111a-1) TaxID=644352 RepID=J3PI67_GAET3|nr:hypothetical protein GGTG_13195 [Gaeumannomyces tritici R3-111a-1]EJT69579.1 hypothetical protein GGTG_13195 [Gaeumannomyces tritici R3-111a-1]
MQPMQRADPWAPEVVAPNGFWYLRMDGVWVYRRHVGSGGWWDSARTWWVLSQMLERRQWHSPCVLEGSGLRCKWWLPPRCGGCCRDPGVQQGHSGSRPRHGRGWKPRRPQSPRPMLALTPNGWVERGLGWWMESTKKPERELPSNQGCNLQAAHAGFCRAGSGGRLDVAGGRQRITALEECTETEGRN